MYALQLNHATARTARYRNALIISRMDDNREMTNDKSKRGTVRRMSFISEKAV